MKRTSKHGFPALAIALLLITGCATGPVQPGIDSLQEFTDLFADPPSEYRSAPLWDWNEQISEEGIGFQMEEFRKAGMGGVFVHPRPGLLTEYLSQEWFRLFDAAVRKGKELGMNVWIYDENSYPSGFAGGHVPAEMPGSFRHGAGLSMEVRQELNMELSDTVEVVLKQTGSGFEDITASVDREMGQPGRYYIFSKTYPAPSPWYGGYTYVDLLYPGVTEKFLEVTMTRGYERNLADFGEGVPGIFTDEPNLEAAMTRHSVLRWTPDLWETFRKRWGYDLRVNLPSLVEETGNWKKVRHDYYELILEMFVDRWARPWSEYCREKGLVWTGHYWEHGWPEPTHGFDEAAFYIWHQMPGVDMLGNRLDAGGQGGQFGNDRAVRELRSAASQAGWRRTLSETYGGGGWEMDFETQKRLVDWQCVLGVNFVNQHLSYYSLNGVRKFDYPPSFSYHEPWWDHYRLMGDYIGRISLAMSSGDQVNHTLVLQPNTTAWMYFSRREKNPALEEIRRGFKRFVHQLEQHQLEYDLGSENVLKVLGSVRGRSLQVGRRSYSLVVIPAEMENMDKHTFELLSEYLENGGKVLAFREEVPMLDGESSALVGELTGHPGDRWVVAGKLEEEKALAMLTRDDFSMTDHSGNGMLYHQRRILDDGQLLFVVNSHPEEKAAATITLKGRHVTLYDPVTGEICTYPARSGKGKVTFEVALEPAGSALFSVSGQKPDRSMVPPAPGNWTAVEKSGKMQVRRESDNILVVNYLDLKTAGSGKKEVYFMDALIGLYRENGIEMGNPWQHKIQYRQQYLELDSMFKSGSGFQASYHFTIHPDLNPEAMRSIRAVVERPELWRVRVNGKEVHRIENAFWIDRQFPQYAVGQHLEAGKNTLTLEAPRMHILAELMPVYLLGDFLVQPAPGGFGICGGDIRSTGSWKEAGLPFYSQKVAYTRDFMVEETEGRVYRVKLNEWNGSVAEVLVNGRHAGVIAWQPYELDVTSFLSGGRNEITVKVTGSLKNTFGFFYRDNTGWIFGPHSWNDAPEKPPEASGYYLLDYGLMEGFDLMKAATSPPSS